MAEEVFTASGRGMTREEALQSASEDARAWFGDAETEVVSVDACSIKYNGFVVGVKYRRSGGVRLA